MTQQQINDFFAAVAVASLRRDDYGAFCERLGLPVSSAKAEAAYHAWLDLVKDLQAIGAANLGRILGEKP